MVYGIRNKVTQNRLKFVQAAALGRSPDFRERLGFSYIFFWGKLGSGVSIITRLTRDNNNLPATVNRLFAPRHQGTTERSTLVALAEIIRGM